MAGFLEEEKKSKNTNGKRGRAAEDVGPLNSAQVPSTTQDNPMAPPSKKRRTQKVCSSFFSMFLFLTSHTGGSTCEHFST